MKTLLLLLSISVHISAQPLQIDSLNRAVSGYDIVSYYSEERPLIGNHRFTVEYGNAIWWFHNEQNKALFIESPDSYIPQYGGYCSWGMRFNGNYQADHLVYVISDGKLYFNQDQKVQRWWMRRKERNIRKADENWLDKQ